MEEDISERAGSSLHHRVLPESSLTRGRIFSLGDEPNEVIEKFKVFLLPQSQHKILAVFGG